MATPDIERKIYFYAAEVNRQNKGLGNLFDPAPVLSHISNIPRGSDERRVNLPEDKSLYCWVDSESKPQKVRLATIRRSNLPSLERAGTQRPIPLREGEGVADEMHVMFFENNVVGAVYNQPGPRISRLAQYISIKASHLYPYIEFVTLADPEIERRLNGLEDVRLLNLRLEPSMAEVLASQSKPLGDAFQASSQLLDNEGQIELVARRKPYGKGGLGSTMLNAVKRIYSNTEIRKGAKRFQIEGINNAGEKEMIDLLSDDLVVARRIMKQDPALRAVEAQSAFDSIQSAYEEIENKLEGAKRLHIQRFTTTEKDS